MRFSVVIPVYNAAAYLRQCLDSVVSQSFHETEVVCVDDGSTDGSAAILDEYAARYSRFRVVRQENRGTHVARKNGVAAAAGEWCLFLDPDDWLEPDALARLSAVAARTRADIVSYGAFVHAQEERLAAVATALERKFNPAPRAYGRDESFVAVFVSHAIPGHLIGKAVRTEVCRRAFGAMRDRRILFQEDLCALYRIIAEAELVDVVSDRLYHYRIGAGISYRPYMSPDEYFGSFSKFDELQDMKAFRKARFPDESPAARALAGLEERMAMASVSEAIERLESPEDGREGLRRLRAVCSDEVVSAACAEWFGLKGEKLADVARSYGIFDLLGDVAVRQLDYVWHGHNSRLRELGREISALRKELAGERAARERLERELRHPFKKLFGALWKTEKRK